MQDQRKGRRNSFHFLQILFAFVCLSLIAYRQQQEQLSIICLAKGHIGRGKKTLEEGDFHILVKSLVLRAHITVCMESLLAV